MGGGGGGTGGCSAWGFDEGKRFVVGGGCVVDLAGVDGSCMAIGISRVRAGNVPVPPMYSSVGAGQRLTREMPIAPAPAGPPWRAERVLPPPLPLCDQFAAGAAVPFLVMGEEWGSAEGRGGGRGRRRGRGRRLRADQPRERRAAEAAWLTVSTETFDSGERAFDEWVGGGRTAGGRKRPKPQTTRGRGGGRRPTASRTCRGRHTNDVPRQRIHWRQRRGPHPQPGVSNVDCDCALSRWGRGPRVRVRRPQVRADATTGEASVVLDTDVRGRD